MFYIFLISIINLGLGYALANYVYRRRFSGEMPILRTEKKQADAGEGERQIKVEKKAPKSEKEASTPVSEENVTDTSGGNSSLADMIQKFQTDLEGFQQSVAELDSQARVCEDNTEAYTKCIDDLKDVNQQYVDQQKENIQKVHDNQADYSSYGELSENICQATQLHSEKSTEVVSLLESLQAEGAEQGQEKLVEQTGDLFQSASELRDTLEKAAIEVMRGSENDDAVDHEMSDQTRLHKILSYWWADDPERQRSLVMVMIDLDHFAALNKSFGPRFGNLVIQSVEQSLQPTCAESNGTLARIKGQRFAMFMPDADPRSLVDKIETIRQQLELTKFKQAETIAQLTASCAVIGVMTKDTSETLLTRAEETLLEAKQNGRNQTFLHEGKYPAPFSPSELDLSEKVVEI